MSYIINNIAHFKAQLPDGVTLLAVSKTFPSSAIEEAYQTGQRDFGESKVQELTAKYDELPKDIRWHMIGHLQTNKVKYIAPFIHLIHSVDSIKLLEVINKEAVKCNRTIDVLLEVHIATADENKTGFTIDEILDLTSSSKLSELPNIRVCGLMTVGTNTDDEQTVRADFQRMHDLFLSLRNGPFAGHDHFAHLSMGMTHDYHIALQYGSTMVRIGNGIFGLRDYQASAAQCH